MSKTASPARKGLLAAAVLLCLPLQSCFTAGLWASDISPRGKGALTPLAVGLDVVTFPAQLAILDGGRRRGRRGCR